MNTDAIGWALRLRVRDGRAKHALLMLAFEADHRAMVEMSQSRLANLMEVTPTTAGRAISHLIRHGIIRIGGKGNRWGATLYHLILGATDSYTPTNSYDIDMRDYRAKKKRMGRFAEVGLEESMEGKGIWSDVE